MGLSNYPCAAEGVIPLIVMNTVMSVALLKNMFRSVLQAVGATTSSSTATTTTTTTTTTTYYYPYSNVPDTIVGSSHRRNSVSITQYKSLCRRSKGSGSGSVMAVECCVCLCGFEANQEVSELPCKHFFHRGCLDKWFDKRHSTCPLCRSYY